MKFHSTASDANSKLKYQSGAVNVESVYFWVCVSTTSKHFTQVALM